MIKILKFLDEYLEASLCSLLLAVMSVVIFLQVLGRTFGFKISWNEELARYLYIWLIYLGCAYAVKLRRHIRVEISLLFVKRRGLFIFSLISNFLFLVFAVVVAWVSIPILYKMHFVRTQFSPALNLPMAYAVGSVFCGFTLTAIRLVQDTVRLVVEYRAEGRAA
jgi:TRAP-type C4-dicarboxylate transport system permease small subunit